MMAAAARSFPPRSRNGSVPNDGDHRKWRFCGEALFRTRTGDPFLTIEVAYHDGQAKTRQASQVLQASRAATSTVVCACVPAGFPDGGFTDRFTGLAEGVPDDLCDYAGHEWVDAGGGLYICMRCEAERWDDELGDEELLP